MDLRLLLRLQLRRAGFAQLAMQLPGLLELEAVARFVFLFHLMLLGGLGDGSKANNNQIVDFGQFYFAVHD